jgi:hypothetical protein
LVLHEYDTSQGGRRDDEGDSAGKDENQIIVKTMSTRLSKIAKGETQSKVILLFS